MAHDDDDLPGLLDRVLSAPPGPQLPAALPGGASAPPSAPPALGDLAAALKRLARSWGQLTAPDLPRSLPAAGGAPLPRSLPGFAGAALPASVPAGAGMGSPAAGSAAPHAFPRSLPGSSSFAPELPRSLPGAAPLAAEMPRSLPGLTGAPSPRHLPGASSPSGLLPPRPESAAAEGTDSGPLAQLGEAVALLRQLVSGTRDQAVPRPPPGQLPPPEPFRWEPWPFGTVGTEGGDKWRP